MSKGRLTLRLSLMMFLISCSKPVILDRAVTVAPFTVLAQSKAQEPSQLEMWISELRSHDEKERHQAKSSIIALSRESVDLRRHVIGRLLKIAALSRGCVEALTSEQRFLEWNEATDILGTIRATEAIDVLISALDCTLGESLATDAYPATKAIIKIGYDAVPKLNKALEQKPVRIQYMAAQALYEIGGDDAKHALQKAGRDEKDKRINRLIRDMLKDWNNSGKYASTAK